MNNKFYELQFEIETGCLLDCIHCSSLQTRALGIRKYTDEDILNMTHLLTGETYIYFTGGEPLLYDNLLSLCRKIISCRRFTFIGIYTTGNLKGLQPISEELARKMKLAGIIECYFSIYFDSQDEHDRWTKTVGSFVNTIESIKNVKYAGITPKAHLVLNSNNIQRIEEIISFCTKIGIEEVRILKLTPSGNAKNNWKEIGASIYEQNNIIREIISHKELYKIPISVSGYPEIYPCRAFDFSQGCQAGTNLLYIDSLGDIYPCACTKRNPLKYKICNIKELDRLKNYIDAMKGKECNRACLNEVVDSIQN